MFCTGGIRCEKIDQLPAGARVQDVYHLKGGILKYLEEMPAEHSLWQGACFGLRPARVRSSYGLKPGPHIMCHACRRPLWPEDTKRPEFEEGVQCHIASMNSLPNAVKGSASGNVRSELAEARGDLHLGR